MCICLKVEYSDDSMLSGNSVNSIARSSIGNPKLRYYNPA